MKIGKDYIGVAAGILILNKNGEIFLNKRSKKARNERGKWESPGGDVEMGETREEAAKREVKEEFGIDIKILKELKTFDEIIPDGKQHWVSTTYVGELKSKKQPEILEPDKCDAIGWFPITALPKPLSYITGLSIKELKKQYRDMI